MKGRKRRNKKYSPEFKISVIIDMREHHLSYGETMRKYFPHLAPRGIGFLKQWERIYLEEGKVGFYIEKRGREAGVGTGERSFNILKTVLEETLYSLAIDFKERLEYNLLIMAAKKRLVIKSFSSCLFNGFFLGLPFLGLSIFVALPRFSM